MFGKTSKGGWSLFGSVICSNYPLLFEGCTVPKQGFHRLGLYVEIFITRDQCELISEHGCRLRTM